MHIPDGFLSPGVSLAMGVASAGAVALSLHQLQKTVTTRTVPLTGMMGALVFAGQMVNFPLFIGPASGHLLGGVLAAVVLGPWAGCLVITLVLMVQCAFFADGGMLALGANIFNMGVIGALGGYAIYAGVRRWLKGNPGTIFAAVIAAWVSVLAASSMFCIQFALSGVQINLAGLFGIMASFHSVIGIGEALITGYVLTVVVSQRPDLVYGNAQNLAATPSMRLSPVRAAWFGTIAALAVAGFLAPFASEYADGLEAAAEKMGFDTLAVENPTVLVLDDYAVPLADEGSWFFQKLAVSIAGIGGTLIVLGIALIMGRALKLEPSTAEAAMSRDFLDPYSRGNTICHRLPDHLKIFIVLSVVVSAMFIPPHNWPLHGCLAAIVFAAMSVAGIPVRYLLVRLMFFLPMLLGLAIAVPASYGFQSGWDVMATVLMRSTLSFMSVLWLVNVTPFDRLLVAMRKLGLPKILAAILAFMYRYIFVVFDELQRMRAARRSRSFGRRGTLAAWKSNAQLIGMLLIRSMDRAERVHGAMCARGFDGEIRTLD